MSPDRVLPFTLSALAGLCARPHAHDPVKVAKEAVDIGAAAADAFEGKYVRGEAPANLVQFFVPAEWAALGPAALQAAATNGIRALYEEHATAPDKATDTKAAS